MAVRFIFKHFLIRIMAIAIHTSPELSGRTAELFIEAAENRPTTRIPLTEEQKNMLRMVEEKGRVLREKILGRNVK